MAATSGPDPLLAGLALLVTAIAGAFATIYAARKASPHPGLENVPPIPVPGPDAVEVWVATFAQLEAANQKVVSLEKQVAAKDAELQAKDHELDEANNERLELLRRLARGDH